MQTRSISFVALCLVVSGAAAANPTGPTSGRFQIPVRAKQVCQAGCIGYSPSTNTWLCGAEESASGMVMWSGTRCALQLFCGTTRIADFTVYTESSSGTELTGLRLPLDRCSPLLPDDLASTTTTLELPVGVVIKIPGTKHSVRFDDRDEAAPSSNKATRREPAAVRVLCNTEPKSDNRWGRGATGLAGIRGKPGSRPTSIVIRSAERRCGQRVTYQLQLSSEPSQVALVEALHWGCDDYGVDLRTAYPVDVAYVCEDAPAEQRR